MSATGVVTTQECCRCFLIVSFYAYSTLSLKVFQYIRSGLLLVCTFLFQFQFLSLYSMSLNLPVSISLSIQSPCCNLSVSLNLPASISLSFSISLLQSHYPSQSPSFNLFILINIKISSLKPIYRWDWIAP